MKQIDKQLHNLRFRSVAVVILVSLLAFSATNAYSTTRNAGTEAEFNTAYSNSAAYDIINITNNIVVTSEKILSKNLYIYGNGWTISVPIPGLDAMGRLNASASPFRVFTISYNYEVMINKLTIKGGLVSGDGGALSVVGVLWISDCIVSNSSSASGGGGIVNTGTFYLSNSLIKRNAAGHGGGFVNSGTMYFSNSTFSENRSTSLSGGGGAGENQSTGVLYINNSTISNNQSTEIGGGINNFKGTIYMANTSVTGNVAYGTPSLTGGGIGNNGGNVYAVNSLFAYNYHITDGTVANPTTYGLDDVTRFGTTGTTNLYYCIYHAPLLAGTNDVIGSKQYTGLADGSDNTIFSGGDLSKIIDGTGTQIGTALVYRPFLYTTNGRIAPTLKVNSFLLQAVNKGTQTRFAAFAEGIPAFAYHNNTTNTWINLGGTTSTVGQLVAADQMGASRANPPVVGALETATTDALYMVKIISNLNGTVTGGTIYGDVYKSGSSVTVNTIPNGSNQFVIWYYLSSLGVIDTYTQSNPYTFTVSKNINLIPTYSLTAVATGDWNAPATWSGNGVPNSWDVVTIPTGVTMTIGSANANCKQLTINAGGKLTLNTGKTLTSITLSIRGDEENGSGTFVDNGITNTTGGSYMDQWLTYGRNWYLSSPVIYARPDAIGYYEVVSYNESTAAWVTQNAMEIESLKPMKGYVSSSGMASFYGTFNTGTQSVDLTRTHGITKEGFNLVGNPYPSYLNWDLATKTNIDPTMWYRTKNATNTAYVFDTYNATSHIGTGLNGTVVTALVPPMQGFWVRVSEGKSTGTLAFDNTMRSHNMGSPILLKAPAAIHSNQQVVRLQVSNAVNTDEAIVLFNPDALDSYDDYDSQKMSNDNAAIPEIYTTAGNQQLVINGLSSFTDTREIPLGFATKVSNTFTMKASQVSNFDADTKIILRDNLLKVEHDITDGNPYSFVSEATSDASRFTVIFKTKTVVTDLTNTDSDENAIRVFKNSNDQITVNCTMKIVGTGIVSVYSAVGQKLESKALTSTSTVIDKSFNAGVYFVSVNSNGKITTRKLIIN